MLTHYFYFDFLLSTYCLNLFYYVAIFKQHGVCARVLLVIPRTNCKHRRSGQKLSAIFERSGGVVDHLIDG